MTKYKKGEIIKGCVSGIEKYGAFVNLDEYYSGLIHISEISDGFVSNINNFFNIGDTIYVKVIDVDEETCHVKLSIKDIDYKNNHRSKRMKESANGVQPLVDMLPKWIDDKMGEINNK